uniref:Cadherin domain-containing protein n=1 Tax=Parascaris univalens TaxID=6257 RepID=A0A915AWG2_PARUN
RNASRFLLDIYVAHISSDTKPESEIHFEQNIALHYGNNHADIHYALLSAPPNRTAFTLINRKRIDGNIAQLYLTRRLTITDISKQSFYIGAIDKHTQRSIASARIDIYVDETQHEPPKFEASRYFTSRSIVVPHASVLRVTARAAEGAVVYRVEPETIPFDVSPFSGDVFSRRGLANGQYAFDVVATDHLGQEARTSVKVVVEGVNDRLKTTKKTHQLSEAFQNKRQARNRRDLGNDIVISIPEDHRLGLLSEHIRLARNERVTLAPIIKEYVTIYSNGSIELTKALNFEVNNDIRFSVQVDGPPKARTQAIRIEVLDVDEPPTFENGPKPYLAVVPYDRPVGMHVYKFVARDEGGDGDSDVEYRLINTEPDGMFTVDANTGVVRTAVKRYTPGATYRVFVQARDKTPTNRNLSQDSEIAVLEVYAGDRAPQFVKQHYSVGIPEDTDVDYSVVDVKAHRFKPIDERRSKGELTYSLFAEGNGIERAPSKYFAIDEGGGVVHLKKRIDYDDETQLRVHKLIVVAHEDGKESSVPLEIFIEDVNDNPPMFTQPLYTATTREDISIGKTILTVHADDKDSGENAHIIYSVEDRNFSINENGEISARLRLDADQYRERFFIYRFNVTATDRGDPPLRSSATVHIRTENTNDEAPEFIPTRLYTAFVAEDAQGGTPIVQIQALDPDRDQVTYAFLLSEGVEAKTTDLFEIDKDTGLIKLRPNVKSTDLLHTDSPYNLTVIARDDGTCCGEEGAGNLHFQTATVLIGIADVNNNKPEFRECETYSHIAKIEEGDYKVNAPVILKVVATDEDSPPNGDIVYSLYYSQSESRKPFVINPETGELRPSPFVRFDREQRAYEEVTVKATDKGERPLIGFCQFTVQVVDVNDNAPQFDRASYETSISRNVAIGYSVVTVFADDSDAPQNARITYSLAEDNSAGPVYKDDINFFQIMNENSGEITLIKQIPPFKDRFIFNVIASDNGKPEPQSTTVQVIVNVHERQQSAPQWQSSRDCRLAITVDEDIPVNSVMFRCHAVAGDGSKNPISYKMANGASRGANSEQHFREFLEKVNGHDWVVVRNMIGLDYEHQTNYTLTITAMDMRSQVTSDKQFHILVRDKNDVVPRFTVDRFTGTIEEEQTPSEFMQKHGGRPITVVKAEDADSEGPQSEVRYRIIGDTDAARMFRIDELSGGIFPLEKFDREKNDSFILDVEARDSAPSSLPGAVGPNKDIVKVQIFIADINDNAPYFDQTRYEGKVAENAEVNQDVITVKAHDLDRLSNLKYDLYAVHGGRIPFGVRTDSGAVFVKEPLDYEKENVYHMKLMVTDGKHNTTTDLFIYVEDINDNAPQFDKNLYETTIYEEDTNVPKVLFVVKATDADNDEKSKRIVYRLEGQGVGEFFRVDRYTGRIEAVKALDRDPPAGVPVWKFIVQAIDDDGRGLIGYADVQVNLRDINDNAPIFANDLFGTVDENREPGHEGVYVMTASATDYDDPRTDNARLEYSISVNKEIDGVPMFRIVPSNGKIYAMRKLDRELPSERQFVIEVRATDKGIPQREGSGNVTIKVLDVNDNEPYFEKPLYTSSVPETALVGAPVMSVSAVDRDNEAKDNVFSYELMAEHKYFYMTTEADSSSSSVGVLRVKKPLDYEDPTQRDGFNIGVRVYDGRFYATTRLRIRLEDRNDNAPVITGPQKAQVFEDAPRGTIIAKFGVFDADANDTAM